MRRRPRHGTPQRLHDPGPAAHWGRHVRSPAAGIVIITTLELGIDIGLLCFVLTSLSMVNLRWQGGRTGRIGRRSGNLLSVLTADSFDTNMLLSEGYRQYGTLSRCLSACLTTPAALATTVGHLCARAAQRPRLLPLPRPLLALAVAPHIGVTEDEHEQHVDGHPVRHPPPENYVPEDGHGPCPPTTRWFLATPSVFNILDWKRTKTGGGQRKWASCDNQDFG